MIEREIILLLKKISLQLEQVLKSQDEITEEILSLKKDIRHFQRSTLQDLEDKITSAPSPVRGLH